MRRKIFGIGKVLLFLVLLGVCFTKVTEVLERKTSDVKYTPFFQQEADYDVLFMGSSHVVNGVFPMELWKDYGIVSYNFGGHGNQMGTTYWVMQNALDYTTPKLMVIDVFGVHEQQKHSVTAEQMHEAFDAFPMSRTKYYMVQDLFDDETEEVYASRWEYFWDFGKYHSRWNDLKTEDFQRSLNKEKGAESRIDVAEPADYPICDKEEVLQEDTVAMEYLCKMIEECQERGIEVLLTHLPYPSEPGYQIAANSVYEIAEKYGVNYINFVQMNHVVDYTTDCYDVSSHLNPSGARKVTDYLGDYIMSHYEIPDRREDADYAQWQEDYAAYTQLKYENLQAQTSLDDYLMLLRDENLNAYVYIAAQSGYLQDPMISKLLNNVRVYDSLPILQQVVQEDSDYLFIADNTKAKTMESALYESEEVFDTSMGELIYVRDEQGAPSLRLENGEMDFLMPQQENGKVLVKVVVFERESGEMVSVFTEEAEAGN